MANNYTQFAEVITMPREAAEYAVALQAAAWRVVDDETLEPGDEQPARALIAEYADRCGGEWYGTSTTFEVCDNGLYIAAEESGDLEAVALVIQYTFRHFGLTNFAYIEYANTCSRMRPGEFGGGAMVVTKDDTRWLSTSLWVSQTIDEMQYEAALDAGFTC